MRWMLLSSAHFNPRTRVGCDSGQTVPRYQLYKFQSTHPRGVRLGPIFLKIAQSVFQSTHPRGVRPVWGPLGSKITQISIHAPAWGATSDPGAVKGSRTISIHAPAWGATPISVGCLKGAGSFQSTHPRGVRPGVITMGYAFFMISIHAPAWGATKTEVREARTWRISIHAPAWGATSACVYAFFSVGISIHAPAWGATFQRRGFTSTTGFQSTHPRGVRLPPVYTHFFQWVFQSTHPRGVRRPGSRTSFTGWYFNPRTRVGCDNRID